MRLSKHILYPPLQRLLSRSLAFIALLPTCALPAPADFMPADSSIQEAAGDAGITTAAPVEIIAPEAPSLAPSTAATEPSTLSQALFPQALSYGLPPLTEAVQLAGLFLAMLPEGVLPEACSRVHRNSEQWFGDDEFLAGTQSAPWPLSAELDDYYDCGEAGLYGVEVEALIVASSRKRSVSWEVTYHSGTSYVYLRRRSSQETEPGMSPHIEDIRFAQLFSNGMGLGEAEAGTRSGGSSTGEGGIPLRSSFKSWLELLERGSARRKVSCSITDSFETALGRSPSGEIIPYPPAATKSEHRLSLFADTAAILMPPLTPPGYAAGSSMIEISIDLQHSNSVHSEDRRYLMSLSASGRQPMRFEDSVQRPAGELLEPFPLYDQLAQDITTIPCEARVAYDNVPLFRLLLEILDQVTAQPSYHTLNRTWG